MKRLLLLAVLPLSACAVNNLEEPCGIGESSSTRIAWR